VRNHTQSILDGKKSIALEIFNRHLKSCKIQSIFQVAEKMKFNRKFKRNAFKKSIEISIENSSENG
jgi:hypothetical protein